MKIILNLFFLFFIFSCTNHSEKPKISVGEFTKQSIVMSGVLEKILNEPDISKAHAMARSIEEARAVNCIPVENECDDYYKLLNKIVNVTQNGKFTTEDKIEVHKMYNEFKVTLIKSENKIKSDWKFFLDSQNK